MQLHFLQTTAKEIHRISCHLLEFKKKISIFSKNFFKKMKKKIQENQKISENSNKKIFSQNWDLLLFELL